MKCLICSGESAGEVCNKCIRLEKILYQKEWSFKEGMLIKKTEDLRIAISNMRISGRVAICDNPRGLNSRLDNMSHYLMNVKECTQVTYQGKKTLMIGMENTSGENAQYKRYCFLPGFDDVDALVNAIFDAKKKAATLTERIRQSNGLSSSTVEVTPTATSSDINVSVAPPKPAAAAPNPRPTTSTAAHPTSASTPRPKPASFDTVALSGVASDINEFETKIKKLKVLRDNGILTEEEYLEEKKKLVSIF